MEEGVWGDAGFGLALVGFWRHLVWGRVLEDWGNIVSPLGGRLRGLLLPVWVMHRVHVDIVGSKKVNEWVKEIMDET